MTLNNKIPRDRSVYHHQIYALTRCHHLTGSKITGIENQNEYPRDDSAGTHLPAGLIRNWVWAPEPTSGRKLIPIPANCPLTTTHLLQYAPPLFPRQNLKIRLKKKETPNDSMAKLLNYMITLNKLTFSKTFIQQLVKIQYDSSKQSET